ncbi:G5 domain-containing protein [Geobacillus subterraneus]|uniref:G5 domain-containing protein n=1 Tax=Geobacillus subterraneus TaxID=129338 RepID=UPI001616A68C
MEKAAPWKLFAVMAVCTIYFIAFSHLGAFAYDAFAPDDGRWSAGTAAGPVSLADMTAREAREAVASRVNEWKATASIPLQYQEKQVDLSADVFTFQLEESIEQLVDGKRTPLFVIVDLEKCLNAMEAVVPLAALEALDVKRLGADLAKWAARLQSPSSPIDLASYISFPDGREPVVSEAVVPLSDAAAVRWLSEERRVTIEAGQLFSFGDWIKQEKTDFSDEAADLIASAVYQAVLKTNFTVAERYTSRALPDGITPGFEAAVSNGRDLEWFNPNTTDYTLWLQYDGQNVHAAVSGLPFVYQYMVRTGEAVDIEPRTVVQYDARLAPGAKQTKQVGRSGLLIEVTREVRDGARLVRKETVSEDFYPPVYTIEVRGLEIPESSVGPSGDGEGGNGESSESPNLPAAENSEGNGNGGTEPKEGDEADNRESAPVAGDKGETEASGGEEK